MVVLAKQGSPTEGFFVNVSLDSLEQIVKVTLHDYVTYYFNLIIRFCYSITDEKFRARAKPEETSQKYHKVLLGFTTAVYYGSDYYFCER